MSQTTTTVKRLRQAGMSQAAIAREVGVSQPTIAKWEAGKVPKVADALVRLQKLAESDQKQPPAVDQQAQGAIKNEGTEAAHA